MSGYKGLFSNPGMNSSSPGLRGQSLMAAIVLVLLSAGVAFGFREFYYAIFPWVLSKNIVYPPGALTPWILAHSSERDGIEIYVLYGMIFLNIAVVMVLVTLSRYLRNKWLDLALLAGTCLLSWKYGSGIVFTPPAELSGSTSTRVLSVALFGLLLLAMLYLQKRISTKVETLMAVVLLIPFCFVAVGPIGAINYAYIFAPAQKLLEGVKLSQIYFQYDLFITLVAALWMKLGFNLTLFQILGQLSNFVAILGIFLMARSLFRQRALSLLLIIALVLVRIAGAPWEPVQAIQITPLRLDLWLIPFVIIFFHGPHHWLLPLACGVLMLIHGAFGLIYTLGYIQLAATLGALSIADLGINAKLAQWFKGSFVCKVVLISAYLLACYLVARIVFSANIEATSFYQKIGIGFIPMAKSSFFWIYPIVICSAFMFLCTLRGVVTSKYLALGYALIYFTLGNCIYFFGRSHELNLFSIAIPLVFLLFYTLDLFDRWLALPSRNVTPAVEGRLVLLLAMIFILSAATYCSDRIATNLKLKLQNALVPQLHSGDPFAEAQVDVDGVLDEVKGVVGAAGRVQFMVADESKEFLFYQAMPGNTGYFYPFASWIFLDSLIPHAQSLLDGGTYLLIDQKLAESVFDARLLNVGWRYETKTGKYKYVLVARRPPGVPM
jgi:hypothetical protein